MSDNIFDRVVDDRFRCSVQNTDEIEVQITTDDEGYISGLNFNTMGDRIVCLDRETALALKRFIDENWED